jgi:hypothetical protein
MDLDSYFANFSQTTINQDTADWVDFDYYLMLDDEKT